MPDISIARRDWLLLLAFAVAPLGYFPLSEWLAVTPVGTDELLWGQAIFLLPALAGALAAPGLVVGLLFRRWRRPALGLLLVTAVLLPCCVAGAVLGRQVRSAGMAALAKRSEPLVAAIHRYEQNNAAPPETLNALVPEYLPALPSTGIMAYPDYRLVTGEEAAERFAGNPWALTVDTPGAGINWDMMLYLPDQNYPQHGHGGWLEPVGDWAYVHE